MRLTVEGLKKKKNRCKDLWVLSSSCYYSANLITTPFCPGRRRKTEREREGREMQVSLPGPWFIFGFITPPPPPSCSLLRITAVNHLTRQGKTETGCRVAEEDRGRENQNMKKRRGELSRESEIEAMGNKEIRNYAAHSVLEKIAAFKLCRGASFTAFL